MARTEMARVQIEAQMQSFEKNGYTHYVFIARESACDHCAPHDGKIFAVKDI
ncbi:phage minor head protein [Levyella massiliensis]|uniref:phage minor head protein n=1 Tax=Levyella massiliensis TaxID=938289 RepID=UPI00258FFAC6|nr:phage minor head protein [uncultured Levyella sp.]